MFKIEKPLLEEFARLAVEIGVNVQKGQPLQIAAPVEAYELVRECVRVAYEKGASKVTVEYYDGPKEKLDYLNVETEVLAKVSNWQIEKMQENIDGNYCRLAIIGDNPDELNDVDSDKLQAVRIARMQAMNKFRYYSMNSVGQWAIVAYPEVHWARKVFPNVSDEEAMNKLWDAIAFTSRLEVGKTVENWKKHNVEVKAHTTKLNEYGFKSLHFKNSLGTDLTVGLIKDHKWEGGNETASGVYKVEFQPNIPTEEVFTMPDRYHIDGTVVSTKPLSYGGKIIPEFTLTFKDGVVVGYKAKENEDVLKNILDTDEGSKSLGEVALISYDSPISKSNILFFETLFDENASCHLALGACYPTTVKDGDKMSEDELYELGGNKSMNHVDFMFGSCDMSVVGETYDGKLIEVFKDGNFAI